MRSLTRPGQLGLGEIRAGSSTVSRRGVAARVLDVVVDLP